ncbi:pyocin knob domain-containing protein [Aeromonas salmonicida]|uniref:pyocin knob domain-containing protein n=1 Tax=Aeromonas salmonicida TaxID=645 RepID=UPI0038B76348
MPNDYYDRLSEMNPGELADGLAMEQEFDAISRGFAKLPTPHRDGRGFEGPTRVGDPVDGTDAVNLSTLEKLNLPIYRKKVTVEDWNTLTDAGIYDVVNASGANKAPGHPYGVLKVYKFNGVATQEYSPDQNQQGILLKRVCVDVVAGSWGGWDGALPTSQVSAYAKTLLDDADAASARITLGLGTASTKTTGNLSGGIQLLGSQGSDRVIAGGIAPVFMFDGQRFQQNGAPGDFSLTLGIGYCVGEAFRLFSSESIGAILMLGSSGAGYVMQNASASGLWRAVRFRDTGNTTVDANGFIKSASPIMRLHGVDDDALAYFYRDEGWVRSGCSVINSEAEGATAERISTGHYKITGCYGFARDGWYIETPNDANGNKILFVRYQQYADGSIEVFTSTPDYSGGKCAEGSPVDIQPGRWIDLRLCMDDRDIGPNFA